MPESKVAARRARKLSKRRQGGADRPVSYVQMLDYLRESLNKRFYEEQGFPHLEFLAQNWSGPEQQHGDLSNYFELQDMFIGFAYSLARALHSGAPYTLEEREDRVAAVAYALAATLLNIRPDYHDDSNWMGNGALDALRERWGLAKMIHAGVPVQNRFMEKRDLVCLFAIDFVMSFLDMTGELAQMGGDKVISVTNCKDSLITAHTGFVTANLQLANSTLPDFEGIINQNRVTPEFLKDYPDWKPEPADALDVERVGFNSVNPLDMQFMTEMMGNAEFMSDMRNLYLTDESAAMPQGKREEIVMGYVLRYGPRCKQAFAEGRDPTEEEMDRDAEVVNSIVYHLIESVRGAGAPAPEAPAQASEAAAPAEGEAKA